jgi:hypothetical protein
MAAALRFIYQTTLIAVAKDVALHYAILREISLEGLKMTKTVTRMMAAAAALGLVAAPIMAQANTRAGDSTASYSTSNALPGLGRAAGGEGQAEEGGIGGAAYVLGAAAVGLIVFGIVEASDGGDGDGDASPGT